MGDGELARPLSEQEDDELGKLEAIPSWQRTTEQSDRYRELMERRCPPAAVERHPAVQASMDAFNDGDHARAAGVLASLAPPPPSEIAKVERRINAGLRQMSRARLGASITGTTASPIRVPFRRGTARRVVPRSAHGPPDDRPRPSSGDDEPPPVDLEPFVPSGRCLYEHAAAFRGDRRVARWLEAWGDEALGLGDDALWPRWAA